MPLSLLEGRGLGTGGGATRNRFASRRRFRLVVGSGVRRCGGLGPEGSGGEESGGMVSGDGVPPQAPGPSGARGGLGNVPEAKRPRME